MEELKAKFDELGEEEKLAFAKAIMPEMCRLMGNNRQQMMSEMMPMCREMMSKSGMDMSQMMGMMMPGR
ncbi:MAG: hypothetical protein LC641_14090 [Spirochaeta sp.]|nr:hypothetical protein [Spirochaeta sp.]